jgi:hypothetical protein
MCPVRCVTYVSRRSGAIFDLEAHAVYAQNQAASFGCELRNSRVAAVAERLTGPPY